MPERIIQTSRILFSALKATVKLLKDLSIDCAILGGLALAVWGRERVTKDIDIVIGIEQERLKDLLDLLRKSPFSIRSSLKRLGDSLLIFVTYEDKETGFPVNIDLFIAETEFQRKTLEMAIEIEVLGRKLKVIRPEDLILYKLLSPRPIDKVDAEVLFEENEEIVDKHYLKNWAKKLTIAGKLKELLKENA